MRVDTGFARQAPGDRPTVLTIGSFDGVHRGHQALVARCREAASRGAAAVAALTFEPHPRCVLDPQHCPATLTAPALKAGLLAAAGVDRLVVLPFTREVSAWSATRFCDLLLESFDVRALVVGHDFALGHKRQGDVAFLTAYGAEHGFAVEQVAALEEGGAPVSSTRVRALVESGDVAAAARLLGRPHMVQGTVERGEGVGRGLGFPTANLATAAQSCLPATGVYATWLAIDGHWHAAATNVGYRPTFGGDRLTVEAFVLDFEGDLYDRHTAVAFSARLREERAFGAVADLVEQIGRDVAAVRELSLTSGPPAASAAEAASER